MSLVSVSFRHGLGDCVHFAHLLPLWLRRGYEVEVECSDFARPLFELAGARVVPKTLKAHPWMHSLIGPPLEPVWSGNKVACNLRASPLPDVGGPGDLWEELLAVRLRYPPLAPWESPGRPLVLCHFKGQSGLFDKNYPDHAIRRFYAALLVSPIMTGGAVVVLDHHGRTPLIDDLRVSRTDPGTLARLVTRVQAADLLVGIDSGPLHLTRLTDTKALGVWTRNAPWHFALPREGTWHLSQVPGDGARMEAFGCRLCRNDDRHPETLAGMALEILACGSLRSSSGS